MRNLAVILLLIYLHQSNCEDCDDSTELIYRLQANLSTAMADETFLENCVIFQENVSNFDKCYQNNRELYEANGIDFIIYYYTDVCKNENFWKKIVKVHKYCHVEKDECDRQVDTCCRLHDFFDCYENSVSKHCGSAHGLVAGKEIRANYIKKHRQVCGNRIERHHCFSKNPEVDQHSSGNIWSPTPYGALFLLMTTIQNKHIFLLFLLSKLSLTKRVHLEAI